VTTDEYRVRETHMAAMLRSLTLLCTVGAAAALFVQELLGQWLLPFLTSNTLTMANRQRVIIAMGATALVTGLIAFVLWMRGKSIDRFARICAPGLLLPFVPPLCTKEAWPATVKLTIFIALFLLLAERLFRVALTALAEPPRMPSVFGGDPVRRLPAAPDPRAGAAVGGLRAPRRWLPEGRWRRWLPVVLVGLGVVGYATYMSVFTLFMHGRFQTYNFDLGQYDNVFWSTLHGHPLRDTPLGFDKNWEELRGHADLAVFFFLPFYALRPTASTLLVLQSCAIAVGAIPLYRFAARRLPRPYAVAITFAYLLYPPTHGLQFYDFHMQPMAMPFVLMVIDFVDERRYVLCAIAFTIAIACREDISVGLAILGTFLAMSGHRVRAGMVMAVVATIFFAVMRFVIMPSFGAWGFQDAYKDLLPQGARSFGGIIATMISNPLFTLGTLLTAEKLRYALQILLPLALLPVRRSWLVVSIVPGSIFTLLTTDYNPTIDIGFQYSAHFVGYIFPAAALAIAAYGAEGKGLVRRRAALLTMVTGTVICGVFWGAIPPRDSIHGGFNTMSMRAPNAAERQKHKDLVELHNMIPKDASVAVSEAEMPHVSRDVMRGLRDGYDADYILYGVHSGFGGGHNAERALASGEYEKIAERPGLALLKRKGKAPPAPAPAPQPAKNGPPPPPVGPFPAPFKAAPTPPPASTPSGSPSWRTRPPAPPSGAAGAKAR
jgi:uncharacterized membrane protein